MATTPVTPTPAPTMSRLETILNDILTYSEIVTEVAAAVPGVSGIATLALKFEQIAQAALQAQAASSGQTVAQIVGQLHQVNPIP